MKLTDKHGRLLSNREFIEKIMKRIEAIWLDIKLMLLRWIGCVPSHLFRIFWYKFFGIQIGKGSRIHMWANFFNPTNITIGKDSIIGDHVFLDGRDKLVIGDHTAIASQVLIYNSQHDIASEDFEAVYGRVLIGNYVFIGPRVIILPQVTIGDGAVVGAGAVVTKNVEPGSVVAGVPAEEIGKRPISKFTYRLGRARLFQ